MATGALTVDTPTLGASGPAYRCAPYSWPRTLLLHLGPGALVLLGYLALLPAARRLAVPPAMAIATATLLIGVPVQLGFLLLTARRPAVEPVPDGVLRPATHLPDGGGRVSDGILHVGRTLADVGAFRRRLPSGQLAALVTSCLLLGLGLYVLFLPLINQLEQHAFDWLQPTALLSGGYSVSPTALVVSLLVSLAVDGLINPVVSELYFRGHLMPRLPVAAAQGGWLLAPAASAALFAVQQFWQPQFLLLTFAFQTVLAVAVWQTRCLAVAIVARSAANVLGICLTLIVILVS